MLSLRLQLWEQDHVADAFLAGEHHAEAIDSPEGSFVSTSLVSCLHGAAWLQIQREDVIKTNQSYGREMLPVICA